MATERKRPSAPRLDAKAKLNQTYEQIALYAFIAFLVVWNLKIFVFFVAIPWLIGMAMLVAVNLLQHDDCDTSSVFDHSRNFTGRVGKWFFFNNGYHTVHHLYPHAHWSALPDLHEQKVKPHMRPELAETSILIFALKK
jgi:fatty acid desaturase